MDHLIYVLWTDYWKPLLLNILLTIAYTAICIGAVLVVVFGAIGLELYMSKLLGE